MEILRYAAFSADPGGGNPAGVVLDATGATDEQMLAVAADVGYSETAFLVPIAESTFDVRYFSPHAEVPFCGHATIAAAVAQADRHRPATIRLNTRSGPVTVSTALGADGLLAATLVSVPPTSVPLVDDLEVLLTALHWSRNELDPALTPRAAYAGAWHPIIAAGTRARLATLDYDYERLAALMAARSWTTVNLIWRESTTVFHSRNPFPPGGVVEDPATGAAAAALGGYLREGALVPLPATVTIHQGAYVGRPGLLTVDVPADPRSGISVTGTAVPMTR